MSVGLKALLALLLLFGSTGLAVGIWGDRNNWWDELGFTSNILAGTTGACFGIPFAVVLIRRLLDFEQQRSRRREALLRASSAAMTVAMRITDLVPRHSFDPLRVTEVAREARITINQLSATTNHSEQPATDAGRHPTALSAISRAVTSALAKACPEGQQADHERQTIWYSLQYSWQTVENELRAGDDLGLPISRRRMHHMHTLIRNNSWRELVAEPLVAFQAELLQLCELLEDADRHDACTVQEKASTSHLGQVHRGLESADAALVALERSVAFVESAYEIASTISHQCAEALRRL